MLLFRRDYSFQAFSNVICTGLIILVLKQGPFKTHLFVYFYSNHFIRSSTELMGCSFGMMICRTTDISHPSVSTQNHKRTAEREKQVMTSYFRFH